MTPVLFRPAANQDLVEAVEWYESRQPGLGARFFEDLDHLLSRVEESPDQFPVVYRDTHRALLRRFPFAVFFRKFDDRTLVVAIADLRRRPRRRMQRV